MSRSVFEEAENNIQQKFAISAWQRYLEYIKPLPFIVAPAATDAEITIAKPITGEKDAHVLAAALTIGAAFVITLDLRLERRINRAELPVVAMSPGTFIQTLLVQHPDYDLIRDQSGD